MQLCITVGNLLRALQAGADEDEFATMLFFLKGRDIEDALRVRRDDFSSSILDRARDHLSRAQKEGRLEFTGLPVADVSDRADPALMNALLTRNGLQPIDATRTYAAPVLAATAACGGNAGRLEIFIYPR